jgi:asparagine synthase (glutamine-hydrolysing)
MFYVSSGHYYTANTGFVKYSDLNLKNFEKANQETDFALIRNALIKATQKEE